MSSDVSVPKDRIAVTNEAIKTLGKVAVTYLVTVVYLGITAASTTHAQLLRGRDLELPLLNVQVPVFEFFRVAAAMTVVLHLVFLLQVYFVYSRLRCPAEQLRRDLLMPSIFSEAALQAAPGQRLVVSMVRLSVLLILMVPLGLIALIQTKFLPYHDPKITRWAHQLPALIDFALCLWLVPKILSVDGTWRSFWTRRLAGRTYFGLSRFGVLVGCIGLLFFSCRVADVPEGARGDEVTEGFVRRHLEVSAQRLVDAESWTPPRVGSSGLVSLILSGRNLSGGDFSQSILHGVDFRGADLRWARFAGADMRGADFSARAGKDGSDGTTDLTGAKLVGADLEWARLEGALLVGADLSGADLRNARLDGADLRRADLSEAHLDGASLRFARLTGAKLEGAVLDCADLYAVDAEGLQAAEVRGQRTELRRAKLTGASFVGAELRGADFSDAIAVAADFRGADLRFSQGLSLIQMDLRRAEIAGSTVSGSVERAPSLVDARAIGLVDDASGTAPPPCRRRGAESNSSSPPRDDRPVAAVLEDYASSEILLDDTPRGPTGTSERRFVGAAVENVLGPMAGGEVPVGCRSSALATVLALRAVGCTPPRDPVLEELLLPRLRDLADQPADCPAVASLAAELRRQLPTTDGALDHAWPAEPDPLYWKFAEVDCQALRDRLWELAIE